MKLLFNAGACAPRPKEYGNHMRKVLLTGLAAALALGGCANMGDRERHTAIGAGIGAAAGAAIGVATAGGNK
ncbi:MAG: hypothetical protein DIU74_007620, partial [Pseudomonadota bacterium]